jgi:LysM repeat protein
MMQPSPLPQSAMSNPTPDPTRLPVEIASEHVVQSGETLSLIARRYNVDVETLTALNELDNPNLLSVGQTLKLPDAPADYTPDTKLIPDSRLVCGPGCRDFDIAGFINTQPGYIRTATDEVGTRLANGAELRQTLTAAEVFYRVSWEYSLDPRLLLALLEYRAGWLSNPSPAETQITHPLISEEASGGIDRAGLYRQLAWAANELNRGYYGWKYRGDRVLQVGENVRLLYAPGLNAGTIGLQYMLSLDSPYLNWLAAVRPETGLYATYTVYFGNPFTEAIDPLVPAGIQQPEFALPFEPGKVWRYTGGPHGGWGSGSAWASVDFAPPDKPPVDNMLCYTSTAWVTAVAPGVIARSDSGTVMLDLDGDGNDATGWTVAYLHIAEAGRIAAGTQVNIGDRIGHASCEGGFSTATHIHIGRRYNGEWLPADCQQCDASQIVSPLVMDGWQAVALAGQPYQGFLTKSDRRVQAEQGRTTTINEIARPQ